MLKATGLISGMAVGSYFYVLKNSPNTVALLLLENAT